MTSVEMSDSEPEWDLDEALTNSRARAVEFDQMIRQAVSESAIQNLGPEFAKTHLRDHHLLKWDLVDLFDSYKQAGAYPLDRLPGVADRAIDLKLQLFFVSQLSPGIHNHFFYGTDFDLRNPQSNPRQHLLHLYLMQAEIGQVRILWERLMTLVYFLEEGKDPGGRSTRKRFFSRIESSEGRWDVLAEWESFIDNYDRLYRTPEYHNRSSMRKALFGDPSADPNSIASPLNPVMGGFWEVLSANVRGVRSPVVALGRRIDPALGPAYPAHLLDERHRASDTPPQP